MSETPNHEHVGPIVFSNETARKQLRSGDYVITFRKTERTTGSTWWRKTRTGDKQGDCVVGLVSECDPSVHSQLDQFMTKSGFESVEAWQHAIKELNDGELPENGYLYRVYTI